MIHLMFNALTGHETGTKRLSVPYQIYTRK